MTRKNDYFVEAVLALGTVSCLLVISFGLLPGLLAACAAFALTRSVISKVLPAKAGFKSRMAASLAVGLIPLTFVGAGLAVLSGNLATLPSDLEAMGKAISELVIQWRAHLPEALWKYVPADTAAVNAWLIELLKSQAQGFKSLGAATLNASLMILVGLVCGILLANVDQVPSSKPLAVAIRSAGKRFQTAFSQVVVAQVWIAGVNALLTAFLLFAVFPLFGVAFPHAGALVAFTFLAGLIPVVGNLLCNVVLTIVGLTVSAGVGVAALAWLIAIHKLEYFINAKVVGSQIKTSAWELIAAIFVMESIFGLPGLVAGPLFYAWLKSELKSLEWV